MSEKEYKEKTENMFARNTILINEIEQLKKGISVLLSCSNCQENKGGYICEKEYNDKCLAQKIEYIKELEEQIEKMKCCYNCKYGRIYFVNEIIVDCLANKVNPNNKYENCDKWKLAE